MCGQFDTFSASIGTWVGGNNLSLEIDGDGAVVSFDNHLPAYSPRGHGVGIGIEADGEVGIDLCRICVPAIGEKLRQGSQGLFLKAFDGSLSCCAMDSHIGDGVSPVVGLGLEVIQIGERSQGPEVVPDVMDNPFFHFPLFVGASRIAGPGNNGEGTEEVQESPVEADDGPHALGDCCQHVVCDKFLCGALEETE